MGDHIVIYITAPSDEVASTLAEALVGEGLVACVNRIPGVRSTYRWQGQLCVDEELLLIAKTRRTLFERVRTRVKELHPYVVPELIAVPISTGSPEYLTWIDDSTADALGGATGEK